MLKRNKLYETACVLARKGFLIFPVHSIKDGHCTCGNLKCEAQGKHPRTPKGFLNGTKDLSQIERWWSANPNSNIGLVTGKASGVFVLDIDPRNGGDESLVELEKFYGELPKTKMVLTGGGGQHFYFVYPNFTLRCHPNLFPGIDIKSDGGYVVAPPSLHFSGRRYELEVSTYDLDEALAPEWLLKRLQQPKFRESSIKTEVSFEKTIPEGSRNTTLTRLAGYLLGKRVDGKLALDLCHSFNQTTCCPPLPHEEVFSIVNSIAKKESLKRQGGQHG